MQHDLDQCSAGTGSRTIRASHSCWRPN